MARKQGDALGIPPGLQQYSPFPFAGMNLSSSRLGMRDQQPFYMENWILIAEGNLRTLWDVAPPLYTVTGSNSIVYFFFYNISNANYVMIFFANGTAIQINTATGTQTLVTSATGTFYSPGGSFPACCQWGSQYLIIGNNHQQNAYWIWDGAILYGAGGISPIVTITDGGTGYVTPPAIRVIGGVGNGVVLVPQVVNGSVVSVTVANPGNGYQINDQITLGFSGGGTDNQALLQPVLSGGGVASVVVTAGGAGYTTPPIVNFAGGFGAGAAATAVLTGGVVTSIIITNPGSGYTVPPNVFFTGGGGGAGAQAASELVPGTITAIQVLNGGTGYTTPPTLTFVGGGGTGAAATAFLAPTTVASIAGGGGGGYTSDPTVTIATPTTPGGVTATATANVFNGSVLNYTITNPGSGYTFPPLITLTGGGGTGAGAVATLTPTSVASAIITNPGTGYFTVPAIIVSSGINRSASATVSLMPYGVSGIAIETFQSRVWIAAPWTTPGATPSQNNNNKFLVSAPGSISDFATSDGGLIYVSTDRFLRQTYTNMRQSNGYLYPFGDSSVAIISGVNTTASGVFATTTFQYQNTDPQVGTPWRDSVQDFGRAIVFANALGVYALYGGAATKISKELDPLFTNGVFPATGGLRPSSAAANIFGGKYYMLNLQFKNPITLQNVTKMIVWDEQGWTIASQSKTMVFIGTQEVNSNLRAWGTDGIGLYEMFQTPSEAITSTIVTKLFGAATPFIAKQLFTTSLSAQNVGTPGAPIAMSINLDTEAASYPLNEAAPMTFSLENAYPVGYPVFSYGLNDGAGMFLGLTLTTTAEDVTLNYLGLSYVMASHQMGSVGLEVSGIEE
jgi:hypothetical protein